MKKIAYIIVTTLILSCSTAKQTQEAINTGNYLSAINKAINKLKENKTRKGNQDIILLLEEAFQKNTDRELRAISFLKKDGNPAHFEEIYNAYSGLNTIQERINPLLPLRIYEQDRKALFKFKDYTNNIISSKNKLSDYLYENASNLITSAKDKYDYRKAYQDFEYLNKINPSYKDTRSKIDEAYQKGLDYVSVSLYNNSDKIIPQSLEEDLLNFNTYDLNDMWTRFHTNQQEDIYYDYEMHLKFNSILISPEQLITKHIVKEKEVKDGWKYALDSNGNVKKDSLGNDIKVDKFKIVKCNYYKHKQHKDVQISGNVSYLDLKTNQQINSYPLSSRFTFEYVYADYSGDKRALDNEMIELAKRKPLPFPSNEQMVYDSGEDLKNRIKSILKKYRFN